MTFCLIGWRLVNLRGGAVLSSVDWTSDDQELALPAGTRSRYLRLYGDGPHALEAAIHLTTLVATCAGKKKKCFKWPKCPTHVAEDVVRQHMGVEYNFFLASTCSSDRPVTPVERPRVTGSSFHQHVPLLLCPPVSK